MALDKQKILSELGSVVNQLQGADCGCMGKLFSNSYQSNTAAAPTCQGGCSQNFCRGHCGHGEPQGGNHHCMGFCNPPKLYADTYNYLNGNLMQPVVKEVYDDLKSISPANTMMNNPMGTKMGLPGQGNDGNTGQGGNMMGQSGGGMGNTMGQFGGGMGNMMGQSAGGVGNNMIGQGGNMMGQGAGNMMGQSGGGMGNMMGQSGGGMGNMMGQYGGGMGNTALGQPGTGNTMDQNQGGMSMGQAQSGGAGNMGGGIGNMMGNFGNMMGMGNRMGNMFRQSGGMDNTSQNPGSGRNMMTGGMTNQDMTNSNPDQLPNAHHQALQQKMGGMGPQICNMMMGDAKSGMQNPGQANMMEAPGQGDMSAAHSSMYSAGQPAGGTNMYSSDSTGQYNQMYGNSTGQYGNGMAVTGQQNTQSAGATSHNPFPASPAHQQMESSRQQGKYGQHSAGIAKFNEMFPGVMSGDLGFDPMSIAIQMNPNNQQQAAMDTMNKMMMGNKEGINRVMDVNNAGLLQPAIKGANAAAASLGQGNQPAQSYQQSGHSGYQNQQQMNAVPQQSYQQMNVNAAQSYQPQATAQQPQVYQQSAQGYQQSAQIYKPPGQANQHPAQSYQQPAQAYQQPAQAYQQPAQEYQQSVQGNQQPRQNYQQSDSNAIPPQQQHVYYTGAPNQEAPANEPIYQQQHGQGDPNTYAGSGEATSQHYIREPIYPADTATRPAYYAAAKPRKTYELNTLGQPVEMLPARIYQTPEPNLPQTLSPQQIPQRQRPDTMRYSNVKSTISKTSLMGARPVGNVPSRSQLQRVYNQYKGSQSFTQQNLRPTERATHSAGSINVAPNVKPVPIERVGGDTYNSAMPERVAKVEHVIGRMGDVPANEKPPEAKLEPPSKQGRCRNGLQDMVFTSYPSSAAWSFHGHSQPPFSTGYRFRNIA